MSEDTDPLTDALDGDADDPDSATMMSGTDVCDSESEVHTARPLSANNRAGGSSVDSDVDVGIISDGAFETAAARPARLNAATPLPPLLLSNSTRSTIYILAPFRTANIFGCMDCDIVIGTVSGIVFLSNCENVRLAVSCKKLVVRNCRNCTLYLACVSPTLISGDCCGLCFGPLNVAYQQQRSHLRIAGLIELSSTTPSDTRDQNRDQIFAGLSEGGDQRGLGAGPLRTSAPVLGQVTSRANSSSSSSSSSGGSSSSISSSSSNNSASRNEGEFEKKLELMQENEEATSSDLHGINATYGGQEGSATEGYFDGDPTQGINAWARICDVGVCIESAVNNGSPTGYAIDEAAANSDSGYCGLPKGVVATPADSIACIMAPEKFRPVAVPHRFVRSCVHMREFVKSVA